MSTTVPDLLIEGDHVAGSSLESSAGRWPARWVVDARALARGVVTTMVVIGVADAIPIETGWGRRGVDHAASGGPAEAGHTRSAETWALKRMRLARLKADFFDPAGQEARVKRALDALDAPGPTFRLDSETWRWIAQEIDSEDL